MKRFSKIFLAIALISTIGFVAIADRNISTNELPNEAKSFINKHYSNATIYDCEIDGMRYDVDLSNGIDLEFSNSGKLIKIDAEYGAIDKSVVKAVLPTKAFDYLSSQGVADKVEEIELKRNSILVETTNCCNHKIKFNLDGSLKAAKR